MKIIFFGTRISEKNSFELCKTKETKVVYNVDPLSMKNISKCKGFEYVSGSISCDGSKEVFEKLQKLGVKYWLQRIAGFENLDLEAAKKAKISVYRVPAYSPESIAEHALTLLLAANRNLKTQVLRVSKQNFYVEDLLGEKIEGKTIGVIGSGKIGIHFVKIAKGIGANVIVFDEFQQKNNPSLAKEYGFKFVNKQELFKNSDFISLHAPLLDSTKHIIDNKSIALMKKNVVIVNTARGGLVCAEDLLKALDNGKIRAAGLDVYEHESEWFFRDCSKEKINDKTLIALIKHPKVILTSHSAYITDTAQEEIAKTTMNNAIMAKKGETGPNRLV